MEVEIEQIYICKCLYNRIYIYIYIYMIYWYDIKLGNTVLVHCGK